MTNTASIRLPRTGSVSTARRVDRARLERFLDLAAAHVARTFPSIDARSAGRTTPPACTK
ncbi:hypothetical protein EDF46_1019 [Frondihabitans sp. PhB188]|uniref:hypothetical protein n=1 Tax=Frondihabitans sp. PhB188 TaxID=2485200 RepID=UPI000FB8896B|nr:hypothetical protein [Frondihabitans sp. PhB188]ROQ39393.1 hypothetical protein EDF46_1019 [Frondihabitans sp. PhB188]